MECCLKISKTTMNVSIKKENFLGVLHSNEVNVDFTGEDEVKRAILNPIKSTRLSEIVKPGEKIAIVTSDITRPMPSKIVLPSVLDELYSAGIRNEDIIIVFALGSHRKHSEAEKIYLVGEEIYSKIKCIDSDVRDYVHIGFTEGGTPVDVFTPVANANRRICLGNIEYHYFAGFSGGAKAIMPGVSTKAAIQSNHKRMVQDEACAGNVTTNPVRKDIEDFINFMPIDFIVNVVLDESKQIIKAVAGHYIHAHRVGCEFLNGLYKVEIEEKADIVITSAGGYPKDLNLYQAQKALDNSKHAVKKGGVIILVASCIEGLGEKTFEEWLINATNSEELIEKIKENFKLGGHKAAAIAMVLKKADIYLVSDLEDELVKNIFLKPFKTIQSALDFALEEQGVKSKVLVIPYGGSILPSYSIKN